MSKKKKREKKGCIEKKKKVAPVNFQLTSSQPNIKNTCDMAPVNPAISIKSAN